MMTQKSERGSALLMTIVVTIIVLFLGSSLGLLAMVETRMASREEASMQAYYLARSGADAMAQAIISDPALLDDPTIQTEDFSDPVSLGDAGEFQVRVIQSDGLLRVRSKGTVRDQQRMVELTLSGGGFFNHTVVAYGSSLSLGGATVHGSVAASQDTTVSGYAGEIVVIPPDVTPPTIWERSKPDLGTAQSVPGAKNDTIAVTPGNAGIYYTSVTIKNKETLAIDLEGQTRSMIIDTLDFKGSTGTIKLINEGRLLLWVNYLGGNFTIEAEDPTNLTLYYLGEHLSITSTNNSMVGNIVVLNDKATVTLNGGHIGNLFTIGKSVDIAGNYDGMLIYAPNGRVETTGNSFVKAVMAQTIVSDGKIGSADDQSDLLATFPEDIFGEDFDLSLQGSYKRGSWSAVF